MTRILREVKLNEINEDEYRCRLEKSGESFEELVKSIQNQGVLVPVLLEYREGQYNLVAGHRRVKAAKIVGMVSIPALVGEAGDKSNWAGALTENMVREDLTPVEEAAAIRDCLDKGIYDIAGLTVAISRSTAWIKDRLDMCEWPGEILEAVHLGKISVAAARNLARIADETQREMLVSYAVENGATARITAAWLQAYRAGIQTERPGENLPAGSSRHQESITPYTPCVICGGMQRMIDLRHIPVCTECNQEVISAVKRSMQGAAVDKAVKR